MLGKCFKYEFKSYSRLLVPMMIACCASGIIMHISMHFSFRDVNMVWFFSSIGLLPIMFGSGIGSVIVCFIQAPRRFYSSMLSKESYLIRTLPVSTHIHVFAIMLNSLLWFLLCLNTALLSFYLTIFEYTDRPSFTYALKGIAEFWQDLFSFGSGFNIIHLLTLYLFGQIVIMLGTTVGSIVGKGSKAAIAGFVYLSYNFFSFVGSMIIGLYYEIMGFNDPGLEVPANLLCIYGLAVIVGGFAAIIQLINKKADVY